MKQTRFSRKFKALTLPLFVLVYAFFSLPVSALNEFYNSNDIRLYDKNAQGSTICVPGATTSLTGSSNKEKVWNFLRAKGLTAEQAAGIMGNLQDESGFIPDINERDRNGNSLWPNGGWGIAQWTGSRRALLVTEMQKSKLPYTDQKTPANLMDKLLLFELNYLWGEATGTGPGDDLHKDDINKLKSDTAGKTGEDAVAAATASWQKWYERPANPDPSRRIGFAKIIYAELGGTPVGTTSTNAGCTGASVAGFAYYSQYDPAWSAIKYGTSTIKDSGCGPTSMAMIISTLTKRAVTPRQVAEFGSKFYIPGKGSSHELFTAAATQWGLKGELMNISEPQVKDVLSKGGLVIAAGSGAYPYTTEGHVIVIRGITSSGDYLLGNPLPEPNQSGVISTASSAEVAKNLTWYNRGYEWSTLAANTTTMYAITK